MLEIIDTFFMIYDRIVKNANDINCLKLSKHALLRTYYFEVISNLELLNVIDTKKLNNRSVNSPSVFSIVKNLEIQFAAFKADKEEDIINTLRLKVRVENIREHLDFIRKRLNELNKTENFLITQK
jgi:hypothetical protein